MAFAEEQNAREHREGHAEEAPGGIEHRSGQLDRFEAEDPTGGIQHDKRGDRPPDLAPRSVEPP